MNCDVKSSDVLIEQLQCFEYSLCQELELMLNMTVNMAIIVSNYYSSTSDEHKKLKIIWKCLNNFF